MTSSNTIFEKDIIFNQKKNEKIRGIFFITKKSKYFVPQAVHSVQAASRAETMNEKCKII
jgi:hypothetical protein